MEEKHEEANRHARQDLPNRAIRDQPCVKGGAHSRFDLHGNSAGANPQPQNTVKGILQDYEQLRRSLERMQIDKSITFVRDQQGIKREDQRHFNVIAKCSGFGETIAKLVSNVDPDQISEHTLNNIFLCASAQLAYLTEENANLYIKGQLGPEVATMMRGVLKSMLQWQHKTIEGLSSEVQLAAVKEQQKQSKFTYQRQPKQWNNYRKPWGQSFYNKRDTYNKFSGKQVSNRRPDHSQDQDQDQDQW